VAVACSTTSTQFTASTLSTSIRRYAHTPTRRYADTLASYRRFLLANTNCAVTFVRVTTTTSTSEAVQASWIR